MLRRYTFVDAPRITRKRNFPAHRTSNLRTGWRSAALLLLPFAIAGCGNPTPSVVSARSIQVGTDLAAEQVINRHLEADPRTLDPSLVTDVVGQIVARRSVRGPDYLSEDGSVPSPAWPPPGRPARTARPGRFICGKTRAGPMASRSLRKILFMPGGAKWTRQPAPNTRRL